MKCYLTDGTGIEQLQLAQREERPLQEQDVLIDVKACSLNYRDLLIIKGKYQQGTQTQAPCIPLSDMAGVVRAIGSKVTEWKPGDCVFNAPFRHWPAGKLRSDWARTFIGGLGVDGVLADQLIYPADALVRVPPHLNAVEASTLPIAGLTAWAALVTHGKVRPGDWVLLHGTGGVSVFAAQLAHTFGAKTIVTSSSRQKAEFMRKTFGVTATVNYREQDWPQQIRTITQGKGVDIVVDVAGGQTLAHSLQLCTYGARIGVVGVLSGQETTLRTRDLLTHQLQLRGIYMESHEELCAFARAMEALKLRPCIDKTFPFEEAQEAYRHLEAQQHIGKVVITLT